MVLRGQVGLSEGARTGILAVWPPTAANAQQRRLAPLSIDTERPSTIKATSLHANLLQGLQVYTRITVGSRSGAQGSTVIRVHQLLELGSNMHLLDTQTLGAP